MLRRAATGSTDGAVKVWNVADLSLRQSFPDTHRTQKLAKRADGNKYLKSAVSTFGVMHVAFWKNCILSCGADGRIVARPFKRTE